MERYKMEKDFTLRSVRIVPEIEVFEGKHCLLPFGITVCGLPTIEASKEQFPALSDNSFKNFVSEFIEYTGENWDVTCKKCLEMFEIMKNKNHGKI